MRRALLAAVFFALPAAADAACADRAFEGQTYTVCEVTAAEDLRLFQTAADGAPYGSFARVNEALAGEGRTLGFAMNAGMYHPDRAPVGLLVEDGTERARLVTSRRSGQFRPAAERRVLHRRRVSRSSNPAPSPRPRPPAALPRNPARCW